MDWTERSDFAAVRRADAVSERGLELVVVGSGFGVSSVCGVCEGVDVDNDVDFIWGL